MKKPLKITLITAGAAVLIAVGSITAVSVHRNSPEYALSSAERCLSERNYEQAVIEFEKYLEINPKNSEVWLMLADTYEKMGEDEKVRDVLEYAVEEADSHRAGERLKELEEEENEETIVTTEVTEVTEISTEASSLTTTVSATSATTTTVGTTTTTTTTATPEVSVVTTPETAVTTTTTTTTTEKVEPEISSSDYPSLIDTSDEGLINILGLRNSVNDMVANRYYTGTSEYESRFILDRSDSIEFTEKHIYDNSDTTPTDYYRVVDGPFTSVDEVYAYLASFYTDSEIEAFRNDYGGYGAFFEKDGKFYAKELIVYANYIVQQGRSAVTVRSKTNKRIILDYVGIVNVMNEYWYEPHSLVLINDGNGFKISGEKAESSPDKIKIGSETYSTDLEYLELFDVNDKDILNLIYMKNLKEISIFNSPNVTNIWVIESCPTIEKLTVNANIRTLPYCFYLKALTIAPIEQDIFEISSFSGRNLEEFEIIGSGMINFDLNHISTFTNLKKLSLRQGIISDLSPVSNLTNLEELDLSYTNISDITPLKSLTSLRVLHLAGNNITDVTPLKKLKKLEYLSLFRNYISDPSPLYNLTKLEELTISDNNLSSSTKNKLKKALPDCIIK